jgi:predicted nucleotidyltransferase
MEFDVLEMQGWVQSKEYFLPGLSELFGKSNSAQILIIGASVFELYNIQGWIPKLNRQTGDIDLSVGVIGDDSLYVHAKNILLSHNYSQDQIHPYRFHPLKKVPGGYGYIDLLAHSADQNTPDRIATNAMQVSSDFNMKSFAYAQKQIFTFDKNITFPNPFGFIALKRESYLDEPNKRQKDFADILELISGLVENGTHFKIDPLWNKISAEAGSKDIQKMLADIINENNPAWDIADVRTDLIRRNFAVSFIDETLPQRIKDFYEIIA